MGDEPGPQLEPFVRLSRKSFDHALWREDRVFSRFEAWLDMIATARFEDMPEGRLIAGRMVNIERGQLAASTSYLAKRWRWSKARVFRYLSLLRCENMIETASETGVTVITLLNYDRYNPTPETVTKRSRNDRETVTRHN